MSLTREQFAWIVTQRAFYSTPVEIVREYPREFKGQPPCTLADVALAERAALPVDWQTFFDEQRETYLNSYLADKRARIGELTKMYNDARDRKATTIAADLLEQIAKEASDAYAPKSMGGSKSDGKPREITEIIETIIDPAKPVVTVVVK